MKNILSQVVIAVMMLSSLASYAGDSAHGGGGFLKNNKAMLLDLTEARSPKYHGGFTDNGLNIVESKDSVDAQIEKALTRLDKWIHPNVVDFNSLKWKNGIIEGIAPTLAQRTRESYELLKKIRRPIGSGYRLLFPTDADLRMKPENSKEVGLALWQDPEEDNDSDVLWYDAEYVKLLSNTEQAALWVHEALYKTLRVYYGESDSKKVRKIVGYLFSDIQPKKITGRLVQISNGVESFLALNNNYSDIPSIKIEIAKFPSDAGSAHHQKAYKICQMKWTIEGEASGYNAAADSIDFYISPKNPSMEQQFDPSKYTFERKQGIPIRYETGECDYHFTIKDSHGKTITEFEENFIGSNSFYQNSKCSTTTIMDPIWKATQCGEGTTVRKRGFLEYVDVTNNPYVLAIPVTLTRLYK